MLAGLPDPRRKTAETHHPFLEKICLAVMMGESCRSKQGLGLDREGKISVISGNPERSEGEILQWSQIRDQG
jgi:hypothetical protein